MAAKRTRPGEGDQDFGFLSSGNEAETESAPVDFGFTEFSSESPTAASDQFTPETNSDHLDFDEAPAESTIPAVVAPPVPSSVSQSVDAVSVSTSAPASPDAMPKVPTPSQVPVGGASPKTVKSLVASDAVAATPQVKSKKSATTETPKEAQPADQSTTTLPDTESVKGRSNSRLSTGLLGYAIALTLLFLGLLLTGRLSLTGNSVLESLPDLRPLAPNEFRRIEDGAELPKGHVLKLGESRQFGDVVVTPVRLTKEPLQFQGFLSGEINQQLTSQPVLKLWLNFESVADNYAYPPFDSDLMSNRTPPFSRDASTLANSFLTIFVPSLNSATTRKLNYLHTMDNNFVIAGQNSARVLQPGESMMTFIAASENDNDLATDESTQFVWRIQFRKGVNVSSGNGVTTLIDVKFSGADIEKAG